MPKASAKPEADKDTSQRRDELQVGARLKHARLLEGIRIRELAERVRISVRSPVTWRSVTARLP